MRPSAQSGFWQSRDAILAGWMESVELFHGSTIHPLQTNYRL